MFILSQSEILHNITTGSYEIKIKNIILSIDIIEKLSESDCVAQESVIIGSSEHAMKIMVVLIYRKSYVLVGT